MRRAIVAAFLASGALGACSLFEKAKATDEDPAFPVAATGDDAQSASGASLGGNYLVSFVNTSASGSIALFQLFSESGLIGTTKSLGANKGDLGAVAQDGTNFLAVTQFGSSTANLWGQFVGADGVKVGSSFQITNTDDDPAVYSLTFGGGAYLVTYGRFAFDATAGSNVFQAYARTISTSGVVGPELTLGNAGQISASDFDGTNFFVVYPQNGAGAQIKSRTITTAGVLGASVGITASGVNASVPVAIARNGANHLVAWGHRITGTQDADSVSVGLFTSAGAAVGTAQSLALTNRVARVRSVVSTASGFFVVWTEKDGAGALTTRAQSVTALGVLTGSPITLFAPTSAIESVAAYLVSPATTKVMALLNRKISGKYSVYAQSIPVP